MPSEVSPVWVAFSVSVGDGLFFGLYPAKRAAELDPIVSLRYELRIAAAVPHQAKREGHYRVTKAGFASLS